MPAARRLYDQFAAYRRYRRDGSRESIIVLAIAGIVVSTADTFIGAALAWRWPALGESFHSSSKNARVAMTGLPMALIWLVAAFGSDWRRARHNGDLEPYLTRRRDEND